MQMISSAAALDLAARSRRIDFAGDGWGELAFGYAHLPT